jgi:NAD(P)-dependent dehydrogenase (short-subunit alcohol dehydrogenase family)
MTLKGKRIVIIGGSSGIGYAVAEGVLGQGAKVTIASSDQAKVGTAVARLGKGATGFAIDVRDPADVARTLGGIDQLDHLVYTAGDWGGMNRRPVADLDLEAAKALFTVRFWGAVTAIKALHGRFAPGGSITLTNGMIAHRPTPGAAVSSAMAGAVEHLVRGLAVEMSPVRVNGVCPGLIATGVWDGMAPEARDDLFTRYTARQPLARAGSPAETAEAYLYLMRAGYTTGQVLKVDGGASVV